MRPVQTWQFYQLFYWFSSSLPFSIQNFKILVLQIFPDFFFDAWPDFFSCDQVALGFFFQIFCTVLQIVQQTRKWYMVFCNYVKYCFCIKVVGQTPTLFWNYWQILCPLKCVILPLQKLHLFMCVCFFFIFPINWFNLIQPSKNKTFCTAH